jgi:hypothetical protein
MNRCFLRAFTSFMPPHKKNRLPCSMKRSRVHQGQTKSASIASTARDVDVADGRAQPSRTRSPSPDRGRRLAIEQRPERREERPVRELGVLLPQRRTSRSRTIAATPSSTARSY